jgi:hypothetical protein
LLEEVGSILLSAAASLRLPATSARSNLTDRDLRSCIEHTRQQLHVWQGQLAQEVKQQGASQTLNADGSFIAVGVRLAVRGAILTDLRRMLDEVHDVIETLSLPALRGQMEEQAMQ